MIITQRLIEQGKSSTGGWNRNQLLVLGAGWPPTKGWRKRLEGQPITEEDAARFLELRDADLPEAA